MSAYDEHLNDYLTYHTDKYLMYDKLLYAERAYLSAGQKRQLEREQQYHLEGFCKWLPNEFFNEILIVNND